MGKGEVGSEQLTKENSSLAALVLSNFAPEAADRYAGRAWKRPNRTALTCALVDFPALEVIHL
jgi:hypothetical protein